MSKKKPAESDSTQQNQSNDKSAAAAAGAAAATGTTGNTPDGTPPSGTAAGTTASPETAPNPAPPVIDTAPVKTRTETTESRKTSGVGGWILAGLSVLGLIGVVALAVRRRREDRLSILDRSLTRHRPFAPAHRT